MSVVLVVEPDTTQAGLLKKLQKRIGAKVVVAKTTDDAIDVMNRAMPDVILLSALLSPRDEKSLITHLRSLEGASHLQTLTIPQLRTERAAEEDSGKKGFSFRKKRESSAPVGCDPATFAEEIVAHLARAAEIKSHPPAMSRILINEPPPEPISEPSSIFVDEPAAPEPLPSYEPVVSFEAGTSSSWDPKPLYEPTGAFEATTSYEPVPSFEPAASYDAPSSSEPPVTYEPPKFSVSDLHAAEESLFAAAEKGVFSKPDPPAAKPVEIAAEEPAAVAPSAPSAFERLAAFFRPTSDGPKDAPVEKPAADPWAALLRASGGEQAEPAAIEPAAVPIPVIEEKVEETIEVKAKAKGKGKKSSAVKPTLSVFDAPAEHPADAIDDELSRLAQELGVNLDSGIVEIRNDEPPDRVAVEVAAIHAESEAKLAAEVERVRVEAEERRLAEVARLQADADAMRIQAEAEAKRVAELERVRAEAEERRLAEVARLQADADAMRIQAEAEAKRAAELERVRAQAEEQRLAEVARLQAEADAMREASAKRVAAEVAAVQAEATAKRAAELERVRIEAEERRIAELARLQADADAMREAAIADARAAAEQETRRALASEVARVRSEAEGSVAEAVNRVKVEAEQTLSQEIGRAREDAEALRAELAKAQEEASQKARLLEAEVQRVRAGAQSHLKAEIERIKRDAEQARAADQTHAQATAERIREAAALEARTIAEASARKTLEAEIARVRSQADTALQAELARVRAEAQERQEVELLQLRAEMAEVREAAAEQTRAAKEVREAAAEQARLAAEEARAAAAEAKAASARRSAEVITFPVVEPQALEEFADLEEHDEPEAEEPEGRRDYYSLWQKVVSPVQSHKVDEPVPLAQVEEAEQEDDEDGPDFARYTRYLKWGIPIAASLVLIVVSGISAVARFAAPAAHEEPPPAAVVTEVTEREPVVPVESKYGTLKVESTPAGAKITLDGENRGETPRTLSNVSPGTHTLVLQSSAGSITKRVTVRAGKTSIASEAIFAGWLALFSPIPLDVSLNGKPASPTEDGRFMLAPGTYQIHMANNRYKFARNESLTIRPGEVTAHTVSLPTGTLRITVPDGTVVSVDGQSIGKSPFSELLPLVVGTHEIRAVHPERGERRTAVDVRFQETTEAMLPF
jgi:hypothetical protein